MTIDPVAVLFYAIVCGLLTLTVSPALRWPVRVGLGAGVGIVAALALPLVREALGV